MHVPLPLPLNALTSTTGSSSSRRPGSKNPFPEPITLSALSTTLLLVPPCPCNTMKFQEGDWSWATMSRTIKVHWVGVLDYFKIHNVACHDKWLNCPATNAWSNLATIMCTNIMHTSRITDKRYRLCFPVSYLGLWTVLLLLEPNSNSSPWWSMQKTDSRPMFSMSRSGHNKHICWPHWPSGRSLLLSNFSSTSQHSRCPSFRPPPSSNPYPQDIIQQMVQSAGCCPAISSILQRTATTWTSAKGRRRQSHCHCCSSSDVTVDLHSLHISARQSFSGWSVGWLGRLLACLAEWLGSVLWQSKVCGRALHELLILPLIGTECARPWTPFSPLEYSVVLSSCSSSLGFA